VLIRLEQNHIGFAMVSVEHRVEAVVVDRVFVKPEHAEEKLTATGHSSERN
jgi:hypothetical protein